MALKLSQNLKNLALALAGCMVALALLEGALRVYHPLEIRFKPDRIVLPVNKRYVIDNAAKFTKLDRVTTHTKNSLGFRGAPPPADFAPYLTLVTVGGSTTECFYLSDGRTWTDALGALLERDFTRVWANNAGLDGATTLRHLILVEDYLVQLRPKLVLFLVGINDVGVGALGDGERKKPGFPRNLSNLVLNHSEVYALGQNLYRYLVAQERGLHHIQVDLKAQETLDRVPEETRRAVLQEHRSRYLPPYRARLDRLIRVCREHGMEPVLITQPVLYGPGVDPATGVNLETVKLGKDLNGRLMFEIVELYNEALRQAARDAGAPLIDLAARMPRNSAYYYDYLHYTAAGAGKVAEIIYEDLRPRLLQEYGAWGRRDPAR